MNDNHYLVEQIKTIKNLCEISLYIAPVHPEWLPTLLELLYQEAQEIVNEHCIVREVK